MTRHNTNWALLPPVLIGLTCAFALLTLYTWPSFVNGPWQLVHPPAWWQHECVLGIGVALSALPSLAVFQLDPVFQTFPALRYPFVTLLLMLETIVLCYLSHRVMRIIVKPGEVNMGRAQNARQ